MGHLVSADSLHVACTEAEFRDSLEDVDFWVYVLQGIKPGDRPDEDEQCTADDTGFFVCQCVRCGGGVFVDTYEEAAAYENELPLCEECHEERVPYSDDEIEAEPMMMYLSRYAFGPWECDWMYEQYLQRLEAA